MPSSARSFSTQSHRWSTLRRVKLCRCSSARTEWPSIAISTAQRSPIGPPPITSTRRTGRPFFIAAFDAAYSPTCRRSKSLLMSCACRHLRWGCSRARSAPSIARPALGGVFVTASRSRKHRITDAVSAASRKAEKVAPGPSDGVAAGASTFAGAVFAWVSVAGGGGAGGRSTASSLSDAARSTTGTVGASSAMSTGVGASPAGTTATSAAVGGVAPVGTSPVASSSMMASSDGVVVAAVAGTASCGAGGSSAAPSDSSTTRHSSILPSSRVMNHDSSPSPSLSSAASAPAATISCCCCTSRTPGASGGAVVACMSGGGASATEVGAAPPPPRAAEAVAAVAAVAAAPASSAAQSRPEAAPSQETARMVAARGSM